MASKQASVREYKLNPKAKELVNISGILSAMGKNGKTSVNTLSHVEITVINICVKSVLQTIEFCQFACKNEGE